MASGQELRKDSTSETSYWKHSAIERSTSRYTQTAQPASPWQQDKEYQREQNTSNWNSCSSNNWCKTAPLAYTQGTINGQLGRHPDQVHNKRSFALASLRCWFQPTLTNNKQQHQNKQEYHQYVCKTYITNSSLMAIAMETHTAVAIEYHIANLDFLKKYKIRASSWSITCTWYYILVYSMYILYSYIFLFISWHLWTFWKSVVQLHQPAEFNQFC